MSENSNKPNALFWVIGIIALIWNLLGVSMYLMQAYMTDEVLATLPTEEQALYAEIPVWATAAFATAVFAGALGSLLLVLKKKISRFLFLISFVGIIIQMYHSFFISHQLDVYGPGSAVMPIMIIIFGAFLIVYSRKSADKGWLS
jgi:hypothetical protein